MRSFVLLLFLTQLLSYIRGQCPEGSSTEGLQEIWNELLALDREINEEIDPRTLKFSVMLDGSEVRAFVDRQRIRVCGSEWGPSEADVVCKSLGLGKAGLYSTYPIGANVKVLPYKFKCEGWERMLQECDVVNTTGKACENGFRVTCDKTGTGKRETRNNCHCGCKMQGHPGESGMFGYPGEKGSIGPMGPPGEKGDPGRRIVGPIGPSPYNDEAFVERLRVMWKGYPGPWGRVGRKGDLGESTDCECADHESVCTDWCSPMKGLKGRTGPRGMPGFPGFPGPKGDAWDA